MMHQPFGFWPESRDQINALIRNSIAVRIAKRRDVWRVDDEERIANKRQTLWRVQVIRENCNAIRMAIAPRIMQHFHTTNSLVAIRAGVVFVLGNEDISRRGDSH